MKRLASPALILALLGPAAVLLVAAGDGDSYADSHRLMLEAMEIDVAMVSEATGKAELDPRVRRAMAEVPRHEFAAPGLGDRAYENRAVSIGFGETMPRPYVVAVMADLLQVGPGDVVLEAGTGSGYLAAVLSRLVERVYTVESHPGLAAAARERFARLGYGNVVVMDGDPWEGLPQGAPFDAIVVSAAVREVPPPLLNQLRRGRYLVAPVLVDTAIQLTQVWKTPKKGKVKSRGLFAVDLGPLRRSPPPGLPGQR